MILRRLAAALRRQDWFTVLIETGIVVFGVFIGIQVSNWNEVRLERHEETFALERLLEEAENAVAYIEEVVERRDRDNRAREEAIAFIVDPESATVDEADAADALASFGYYPPMTPIRAAYDELIASGWIGLGIFLLTRSLMQPC